MTLAPGTRLGPYQILATIGVGGMGEVYRAQDTKLDRQVALKVLPAGSDPERLARFEREARVLASLNHPNIAAIHGLHDHEGVRFLTMELVPGETLEQRLARGPLPVDEALALARQIADALESAHDQGVIHRDLKPANVQITPEGKVKVLDFGLAKAFDSAFSAASGSLDPAVSPTITSLGTVAGVILGTAVYMSPEQARARPADRRADIWGFGAVLYEMLAGRRAFGGETISETLASVMRDEPDGAALPAGLSPRLRRLIERCLKKDPRQRLQAIGEARIVLEDLQEHPAERAATALESASRSRRAFPSWMPWALAALAATAAVVLWLRPAPQAPTATELSVMLPPGRRLWEDTGYHFIALAPDGLSLAYAAREGGRTTLRLRRLDTREDTAIPGTEGARNLFFSPDGEWIGFFDSNRLSKVSVHGGTPVALADAGQDRLGTWLDDGTIVFGPNVTEPLYRIPESGGQAVALTKLDAARNERTHRFPSALDGGPWVVFTVGTVDRPGDYDAATIDAVSVETGERRTLIQGARRAVWAAPGYLVFDRVGDLYAVPIDPRDPRVSADPVPVLDGVAGEASSGASYFDIARNGTLAWVPAGERDRDRQVGWFDRHGGWTPTPVPPGQYVRLSLSPEGGRAIVEVGPGGGASDLWLADLTTGAMTPLTYGSNGRSGIWLRDGVRLAHDLIAGKRGETIVVRRLDGSGGNRELTTTAHPMFLTDVTPDGSAVLACDYGLSDGRLRLLDVDGARPPRELPAEAGAELAGMISPDGRWLAYVTNKTRREEVCLRRFDGTSGSWQISSGGGGGVRWGKDGREIFYVTGDTLMRVSVEPRGDGVAIGQPEALFEVPPTPIEPTFRDYAYDPRGDRFLFTRPPSGAGERREVALSLGWTSRLAARLNARKGER